LHVNNEFCHPLNVIEERAQKFKKKQNLMVCLFYKSDSQFKRTCTNIHTLFLHLIHFFFVKLTHSVSNFQIYQDYNRWKMKIYIKHALWYLFEKKNTLPNEKIVKPNEKKNLSISTSLLK
jgi:hypothetical protein